jgi:hypothetical protein
MEPLRGGLGGSAGTNEAAAKSAKSASVVGSRGGVGVRQTDIIPKQYSSSGEAIRRISQVDRQKHSLL